MSKHKAQSEKRKVKAQSLKFLVLSFSFALCVLSFAFICFAQEKIIAIVNNDVITQKDLDDFINFMRMQIGAEYKEEQLENKIQSIRADLLEKLIEDRLMLSEARKNNIKIDENRIKAKLADIRKRYPSDAEFQETLKKQGLVPADLESKIRDRMLMYAIIDAKIRSKILISPLEITDFYQKNIEEFKSPQIWEFEAIALEDRVKALEISDGLKRLEDFNVLADKYSLTILKLNMKQGQLKKDVEEGLFKLKRQEISEPIKIEDKYYIFRLNNIIPPRQENLSEAQNDIYSFLYQKKMQETVTNWLDELKKQSYIKILQG